MVPRVGILCHIRDRHIRPYLDALNVVSSVFFGAPRR